MSIERVKQLLKQKENLRLEFKEANVGLPKNLFETICAMLNNDGGDIVLGVDDRGIVKGVDPSKAEKIESDLVNLTNNPQKIDPPFILFPKKYTIDNKIIIHLQVPSSSLVHESKNVVYDRSNDGDFAVKQAHQIADIYNRKRNYFSEGTIYSAVTFKDFNQSLFPKIRNLIRSNNSNHPWLALNDEQMLQKANLWKRDFQTNQEGYTLAAVLLLGKDEVIQQILPHYKTDALLRRENLDRFDDREYIQTNLIDAYEQLMAFVAKHLPEKFYMEGDQRVSLRTKIFREIVANLLVHREYTNALTANLIIYKNSVETINANNPHGIGPIMLDDFVSFLKNPSIAKFFIQLGWVDELGSGVINVNKLLPIYASGAKPEFIEGSPFKSVIPLRGIKNGGLKAESNNLKLKNGGLNSSNGGLNSSNGGLNSQAAENAPEGKMEAIFERFVWQKNKTLVGKKVKETLVNIIRVLFDTPFLRSDEISDNLNIGQRTAERHLQFLRDNEIIAYIGAKKTGGYKLTESFKESIINEQ